MLIILVCVIALLSSFHTANVSFASVEMDNANIADNSSEMINASISPSSAENRILEVESILDHLERARNAIGDDASDTALSEIDEAQRTLTGSIRNTTNIISNITTDQN
ncbi:MAG: hypothetical protein WBL44_01750 [Nitrososphaeraceae archaeon]